MRSPLARLIETAEFLYDGDLHQLRDDLRERLGRPELNRVRHLILSDLMVLNHALDTPEDA